LRYRHRGGETWFKSVEDKRNDDCIIFILLRWCLVFISIFERDDAGAIIERDDAGAIIEIGAVHVETNLVQREFHCFINQSTNSLFHYYRCSENSHCIPTPTLKVDMKIVMW